METREILTIGCVEPIARPDIRRDVAIGAGIGAANTVTIAVFFAYAVATGDDRPDGSFFSEVIAASGRLRGYDVVMALLVFGLPYGMTFGMMFGSMTEDTAYMSRSSRIASYIVIPLLSLLPCAWCWNGLVVHAIGPTVFYGLLLEHLTSRQVFREAPRAIVITS